MVIATARKSFIGEIKPSHIGWGTYRYTDARSSLYGEGYIKIPRDYARAFNIFNDNHPTTKPLYHCRAINGFFNETLLAQGCNEAVDWYAKQFVEEGNLKGIRHCYHSVNAQVGGHVEMILTSHNSLTIRYY